MYQLETTTLEDLKKIKVRNQEEIKKQTEFKLDPVKAYEKIKEETKNFTLDLEKGKEADELFQALLEKNKIKKSPSKPSDTKSKGKSEDKSEDKSKEGGESYELKARARARGLKLLKLQLELDAG